MSDERKITPQYALKFLMVMALLLTMGLGICAADKYDLLSVTSLLLMRATVSILGAVFFVYVGFSYFRKLGNFMGDETRVAGMSYLPAFFKNLGHWAGWILLAGFMGGLVLASCSLHY